MRVILQQGSRSRNFVAQYTCVFKPEKNYLCTVGREKNLLCYIYRHVFSTLTHHLYILSFMTVVFGLKPGIGLRQVDRVAGDHGKMAI